MDKAVAFLKSVGVVVVGVLAANYIQTNFLNKKV